MLDGYESQFDYDCLTLTGRSIHEYTRQGAPGIVSLAHIANNLPADSATRMRESGHDGLELWAARFKTNELLADIYDAIAAFAWIVSRKGSKRKGKPPERYPRPWAKPKKKIIGKNPVPVGGFWAWWSKKAKQRNGTGR